MTAYEEGFTKTCAALGVDPAALSKTAAPFPDFACLASRTALDGTARKTRLKLDSDGGMQLVDLERGNRPEDAVVVGFRDLYGAVKTDKERSRIRRAYLRQLLAYNEKTASSSPFAGAQAPKLNLADPAAIPVIRLRTGNLDTGVSAHFPMTLFNPGTATLAGLDDYYKDVSKDRGVQQKLTSGAIDPKYYGAHTAAVSRVTAPFRRLRATLTDPTFRIDPAVVRQALGGRPPYETYKQLISDYHREMRGLTGTVSRASAPAKGAMP